MQQVWTVLHRNAISELWSITCHMGSDSVTCHLTPVKRIRH